MSERSDEADEWFSDEPTVETASDSSDDADDGDDGGGGEALLNDVLSSIFAVLCIGVLLFAISGVWPPMVAIESPSMEPNINTGDLVLVMDNNRFPGEHQTGDTGVVTAYTGVEEEYYTFNEAGDVIVFEPDGEENRVPIIHRAVFWVNSSENWYPKTQDRFLPNGVDGCEDIAQCPAPHGGFVTLGDNNDIYDQIGSGTRISEPVRPEWVIGTAQVRIPRLGNLRLLAGTTGPTTPSAVAKGHPNATEPSLASPNQPNASRVGDATAAPG